MIQQHFLQQQRLNYNHDRLLDRYNRALPPRITQFRTFGTSSLPGRNYDQYLDMKEDNGRRRRRNSVVAHSRAGIGSSTEIYRLMGDGASETLPKNANSIMHHSRSHSVPLVHAEKFEPVQIYEHPLYGPTPAYLRPVVNSRQHLEERIDSFNDMDESGNEGDIDVRLHSSRDNHLKLEPRREMPALLSTGIRKDDHDDNESPERAPKGYISYKKWKTKYEDLIPVDPLLFNIYTKRRNQSINKYSQSFYASPSHHRQSNLDDDLLFTPTSSVTESITSELPYETSLSSHRRYNRLEEQLPSRTVPSQRLETIYTESELSDDEASPPDSPVPYLSRNKQSLSTSTPFIATSSSAPLTTVTPERSSINTSSSTSLIATNPAAPLATTRSPISLTTTRSPGPLITTSPVVPLSTTSPVVPLTTTSSSTSLTTASPGAILIPTSSSTPFISTTPATPTIPPINRVPATPSTLNTSPGTFLPASASTNISNIPPAPPLPPSLAITSSTTRYATPSSIPITSAPPASLTTFSSTAPYQAPSYVSVSPPSAPLLADSATKAVTFAGMSSNVPIKDDISSSSDSEDEGKERRRRRRKRQAAAGPGVAIDSSSSDG